MKQPPFTITTEVLNTAMEITRLLGVLDGLHLDRPKVVLRKENKIKTIQASLAIEGNTLSLEQVSDLLDGVRVLAPQKDLQEVKNAIQVYEGFEQLRYTSINDLQRAHQLMMTGLLQSPGQFRSGNVGIFAGSKVTHVAPSHKMVPQLIEDLFEFIKAEDGISLLIKSCIFHYEFEFIHPFADGNGRIGRLWQHLILTAFHPVFQYVSIESLIKAKQADYYSVLALCDAEANSTAFIAFMLGLIETALQVYSGMALHQPKTAAERLSIAAEHFGDKAFQRKEYHQLFKTISTATASRDLKHGVSLGLLAKQGEFRTAMYHFITAGS